MTDDLPNDPGQLSLPELFIGEVETQAGILSGKLLDLERAPNPGGVLQELMRAAHSLKGAARIVNLQTVVAIAHAMEDCFVAAQRNRLLLKQREIDVLLRSVDLLAQLARRNAGDLSLWENDSASEISRVLAELKNLTLEQKPAASDTAAGKPAVSPNTSAVIARDEPLTAVLLPHQQAAGRADPAERVVRLTAESLNRLLGLAGEALVESRWLRPFTDSLQQLKRHHAALVARVEGLRQELEREHLSELTKAHFDDLFRQLTESRHFLADRMQDLEIFDRRSAHLSHRLYLEVLRTRMRPFSDGVRRFPRMVRDLARALGKQVVLEMTGDNTQVDRDILERLETPLAHLLRNAVDHGCEPAAERERLGKPPECILRLDARHSAGMLIVTVSDDGRGIDLDHLRRVIVQKDLARPVMAERLTETELLEYLFVPGFTLKETVSEISGRGVGLDVVQNMIRSVRGGIRLQNQPGRGLRIQLQLPLTLSVVRALLVEVDGEPYAIPLSQIFRTLVLPVDRLQSLEGRHHFMLGGYQVGVLTAHQVFDCGSPQNVGDELSLVVLGDRSTRYALLVDRFLGERELVIQPLDVRLGKIRDISAAALTEDGAPLLILDVDELLRSMEQIVAEIPVIAPVFSGSTSPSLPRKKVLAVDDSLSVRELERKLLAGRGFDAHTVSNGADAWGLVQTGRYDLVITDLEMPRLGGLELTRLIKGDPNLRKTPVIVLSYKESEDERLRTSQAGADVYLTKGDFHDDAFLKKVVELIGEPEEVLMIDD